MRVEGGGADESDETGMKGAESLGPRRPIDKRREREELRELASVK